MGFIIQTLFLFALLCSFLAIGILIGNGSIEIYLSRANIDGNEIPILFGSDMSDKEIKDVESLISSIDPKYKTRVKQIFFGKNKTEMNLDNDTCNEAYNGSGCDGMNFDSELTIKWKGIIGTRTLLCHELLHDYIPIKKNDALKTSLGWVYEDDSHAIISDLAKKQVCYK